MELAGRRALVVGLGKSGLAAARLLAREGALVAVTDGKPEAELAAQLLELKELLQTNEVAPRLFLGGITPLAFEGRDLVVVSPGVPPTLEPLREASERPGVEVIGEVELASRFIEEPILGVTGTNGKSTTTALAAHLLRSAGRQVFAGGNLGDALSNRVLSGGRLDATVCELSSYQLERIVRLRCAAACVLNVTPDHLERYPNLDEYARAKERIFANQQSGDAAILNLADARVRLMRTPPGSRRRGFDPRDPRSSAARPAAAAPALQTAQGTISRWSPQKLSEGGDASPFLQMLSGGEGATSSFPGQMTESDPRARAMLDAREGRCALVGLLAGRTTLAVEGSEYQLRARTLRGLHNAENALAAVLLARHLGAHADALQRGLDSYPGLPHRLEPVATISGIEWVNDSKATNVDSVEKSLSAFEQGTPSLVLIMGGRGKGAPYFPLRALFPGRVKALLTIGEESQRVAAELGDLAPVTVCGDLATACARARALARKGDTVLLSPACASYDQFKNFEDRGERFKRLARGEEAP